MQCEPKWKSDETVAGEGEIVALWCTWVITEAHYHLPCLWGNPLRSWLTFKKGGRLLQYHRFHYTLESKTTSGSGLLRDLSSLCREETDVLFQRVFFKFAAFICIFRSERVSNKTASIPVGESDRFQFTDSDYVAQLCTLAWKHNFVAFRDIWWVRISITTHYNSIHIITNHPRV